MGEILAIIGSLASIASLAIQLGVPVTTEGQADTRGILARIRDRLTPEQKRTLEIPGAVEIVGILIIDSDLLDTIQTNIEQCIQRYRLAIRTISKRGASDVVDRQAERCVCDALNRIKRRNNGNLPAGSFENWWQSYRCVDDYDY